MPTSLGELPRTLIDLGPIVGYTTQSTTRIWVRARRNGVPIGLRYAPAAPGAKFDAARGCFLPVEILARQVEVTTTWRPVVLKLHRAQKIRLDEGRGRSDSPDPRLRDRLGGQGTTRLLVGAAPRVARAPASLSVQGDRGIKRTSRKGPRPGLRPPPAWTTSRGGVRAVASSGPAARRRRGARGVFRAGGPRPGPPAVSRPFRAARPDVPLFRSGRASRPCRCRLARARLLAEWCVRRRGAFRRREKV